MTGTDAFTKAYNNLGPKTRVGIPLGVVASAICGLFWYFHGDLVKRVDAVSAKVEDVASVADNNKATLAQFNTIQRIAEDNKKLLTATQREVAVLQNSRGNTDESLRRIEKSLEQLRKDILDMIKEERRRP